jgi:uncharacterized membrane protein
MEIGAAGGCHQRPDRSFFIGGYQFPVCARCTGVLLGQAAAVIMLVLKKVPSSIVSAALLLVMGADWFVQRIGLRESTNIRRLVTGIMGGAGIFFLYANAVLGIVRLVGKKENKK